MRDQHLKQRNSKSSFKSIIISQDQDNLKFSSDTYKDKPSMMSSEIELRNDLIVSNKLSESVLKDIEELKQKYEHNLSLNTQLKAQQMKFESQIDNKSFKEK